jgi:hypothetical protein
VPDKPFSGLSSCPFFYGRPEKVLFIVGGQAEEKMRENAGPSAQNHFFSGQGKVSMGLILLRGGEGQRRHSF